MSTESSSKNASVAVFHIAINTGENIARALRRFLTSVKYANVKYGEAHYRNYLKATKVINLNLNLLLLMLRMM